MESLKKIINLNQAAKISGYTQDYLGYLIRNGDIKAKKVGRGWVTTEEEINDYIFKQKIRREPFAVRGFLSPRRRNNILFLAATLFVMIFTVVFYATNSRNLNKTEAKVNKNLSPEVEVVEAIK